MTNRSACWPRYDVYLSSLAAKIGRTIRRRTSRSISSTLIKLHIALVQCWNQDLHITYRRVCVHQDLLRDHLDLALSCIQELWSYACYLQSTPGCSATLLLTTSTMPNLEKIQAGVVKRILDDWSTVLHMESSAASSKLLHQMCPHVRWQVYREVCVVLEQSGGQLNEHVRQVVMAWFPRLSFSANVEDQFASLEDSVKRGNKSQMSSIANLSACAVRSLYHRMLDGEKQARSVKLGDNDWEGCSVRGLKQRLFSPDTFTGSYLS